MNEDNLVIAVDESNEIDYTAISQMCGNCNTIFNVAVFEPPTLYDEGLHLNKGQILRIRHQFLKIFDELDNKHEPNNEYARTYLNEHKKEHKIYNLRECGASAIEEQKNKKRTKLTWNKE